MRRTIMSKRISHKTKYIISKFLKRKEDWIKRDEVAILLGYSKTTLSRYFKVLQDEGLILTRRYEVKWDKDKPVVVDPRYVIKPYYPEDLREVWRKVLR